MFVKTNKHIEIVRSNVNGLSSLSQRSCDAIFAVLNKHYAEVGVTTVSNLSDLEALVLRKPDVVFLGMKLVPTNPTLGLKDPSKIWISKYLDEHGISYTGSSQKAHELEMNKPLAKQRALEAGLDTSPFYTVKKNQPLTNRDIQLNFPVFIKPANRGGGFGIDNDSVAYNFTQLQSKVWSITNRLHSDSLIEEYLPGREFSVAIMKDESSGEFLVMPIELIAQADEHGSSVLSQAVKSSNTEQVAEVTDEVIKSKLTELAINVFHALEARDYGRIDIRLDKAGTPQFLEANLIPSLISGYGSFPKACVLNINLVYEPMILNIVKLALARQLSLDEGTAESHSADNIALRPLITAV